MIVFDCSRLYPFEYNGLQPHTSFLLIFSHILRVEGNTVIWRLLRNSRQFASEEDATIYLPPDARPKRNSHWNYYLNHWQLSCKRSNVRTNTRESLRRSHERQKKSFPIWIPTEEENEFVRVHRRGGGRTGFERRFGQSLPMWVDLRRVSVESSGFRKNFCRPKLHLYFK